ncbi:hypothetical protein ACQY0O_003311 [Thecaphora frezii]
MPLRHPPIPSNFLKISSSSTSSLAASASASATTTALTSALAPVRPLSIAELADKANEASDAIPFDPSVPIRRYLNGADTLKRQAAVYRREGDSASEFVCLVKCARLVIELLPNSHPQYRSLDSETRRSLKRDGQELLDAISRLKAELASRYDEWYALHPEDKKQYRNPNSFAAATETQSESSRSSTPARAHATDGCPSSRSSSRTATAVEDEGGILFRKPYRDDEGFDVRRILGFGKSSADPASRPKRETPKEIAYQPPSMSFTSSPLDPFALSHAEAKPSRGSPASASKSRSKGDIKDIAYPVLQSKPSVRMSRHQVQQGFAPSSNATARYYQTLRPGDIAPHASSSGSGNSGSGAASTSSQTAIPTPMPGAPALPPQQPGYAQMPVVQPSGTAPPPPPPLQPKPRALRGPLPAVPAYPQDMPLPFGVSRDTHGPPTPITITTTAMSAASSASSQMPTPHHASLVQGLDQVSLDDAGTPSTHLISQEAATLLSHPATSSGDVQAYTEGGVALRPLEIPQSIFGTFLALASSNTVRNLETCALLLATLTHGRFRVTHLVVPKQTATSDSCTTFCEEEILTVQQSAGGLVTVGWIHTHPTQTCFLSSLDLHTHVAYQGMLPEAIAIVCSPAHSPSVGLFRLTDPEGVGKVRECREPGLFHPHVDGEGEEMALYTDAVGRHVRLVEERVEVVDLR